MKTIITLLVIFLCSVAEAKDIQLFNTEVLGKSTANALKLLQDKKADQIEPTGILVNSKESRIIAATVIYPGEITFKDARTALNKIYKQYENESLLRENEMALWRVEDKKFALDLIKDENQIRILYIQFQPTDEVMNNMLKSMGGEIRTNEKK